MRIEEFLSKESCFVDKVMIKALKSSKLKDRIKSDHTPKDSAYAKEKNKSSKSRPGIYLVNIRTLHTKKQQLSYSYAYYPSLFAES